MRSFYRQGIVRTFLLILVGLLLLLRPSVASRTIAYAIASIFIINGIIHILGYIRNSSEELSDGTKTYAGIGGLIIGILSIVFAVMIGWVFVSIIPIMLGIVVLITGISKLQQVIDLIKLHEGSWGFVAILAVINIIVGIVAIRNPFDTANLLIRVIGIGLLFGGVTDLIATSLVYGKSK